MNARALPALLLAAALAASARAQDPAGPSPAAPTDAGGPAGLRPPGGPAWRSPHFGGGGLRGTNAAPPRGFRDPAAPAGGPGEGGRHLERWLEFLRQKDPAEFDRLRALRQQDPEAFRQELWRRLQRLRPAAPPAGAPGPAAPPDGAAPRGHGPAIGMDPAARAEIDRLGAEIRQLALDYAAAADPAARADLERQIRGKISAAIDVAEGERARRIAGLERELARLKSEFEARRAARRDWIEQRLRESLQGAGQPPPPPL